jgi:hypothetical protein
LAAGALNHHGERIVVAEGILPDVAHAHLLEDVSPNCSASTPAEIMRVATEHGDDGSVPAGQKSGGKIAAIWDEPTHRSGGANTGIRERRCQTLQPGFARTPVGIREDKYFKFLGKLFDAYAKIVHFFTTVGGFAGNDDVRLYTRGRSDDAFHDAVRGIAFRSENKEDFVILVVEFAERDQIAFKAGFNTAAGAEHSGARSRESGVGLKALADVEEPLNPQPKEIEAGGDLNESQELEKGFHAS